MVVGEVCLFTLMDALKLNIADNLQTSEFFAG